ncbi:MAG: hypothetical protein J0H99_13775, partial [Rhodospirillales bacterium]|nr:hypothetical protein [Rhodospirillales bacterium]
MPTGNPPWIHPEDILPGRVAGLQRAGYTNKEKTTARIPIEDAMRVIVEKGMLKAAPNGQRPQASADRPTNGNGGRGGLPAAPKAEAPKAPPVPANPAPPKAPDK